jgi:hypothetical protein
MSYEELLKVFSHAPSISDGTTIIPEEKPNSAQNREVLAGGSTFPFDYTTGKISSQARKKQDSQGNDKWDM